MRGKIDFLWLMSVLFDRLVDKCRVYSVNYVGLGIIRFLESSFLGFHGYCITGCHMLRCQSVSSSFVI